MQSARDGRDRLHLGLFNEKTNGKKLPPFGLCVDFDEDTITFSEEDPKTRPEMREHLSVADQIDAIIKDSKGQPWTANDLAEEMGKPDNQIRATLSRHKDRYVKLPGGTWGLAAHE